MAIYRQADTVIFVSQVPFPDHMLASNNPCIMLFSALSESQKEIYVSLNNNYMYGPGCSCGFYSLVGDMVGFK